MDRNFITRWLPWIIATAVASTAVLVIVILVRQNHRLSDARAELSYWLDTHCGRLAYELRQASENLEERLQPLKRANSPDDIARVEAAFDADLSLGGDMTSSSRRAASHMLYRDFGFCVSVRAVSGNRDDSARHRFAESAARFRTSEDRDVITRSVAEMAQIADEVSRWPLRQRKRQESE